MEESVPCSIEIFTGHLHPPYPHANNSSQPNSKAMYERATTLPAPIGIFIKTDQRWKQLQADQPQNKQKFYGLSHYSPTTSITTIQQLGLGIVHTFGTLILNSFKKLVHSKTSPAFDHYDFLFPCDQIIGLLLDNSLDVGCRNVK